MIQYFVQIIAYCAIVSGIDLTVRKTSLNQIQIHIIRDRRIPQIHQQFVADVAQRIRVRLIQPKIIIKKLARGIQCTFLYLFYIRIRIQSPHGGQTCRYAVDLQGVGGEELLGDGSRLGMRLEGVVGVHLIGFFFPLRKILAHIGNETSHIGIITISTFGESIRPHGDIVFVNGAEIANMDGVLGKGFAQEQHDENKEKD